MDELKSYLLLTATGAVLVMTRDDVNANPDLLKKLAVGSLNKFIAYEVPLDAVKNTYQAHFEHVLNDPRASGEFVVIDDDGQQIFENIDLKDLGRPFFFEEGHTLVKA
jgi:hypothetical protein